MAFNFNHDGYKRAIENEFTIIDKNATEVPFALNKPQAHFIDHVAQKNIILKARQLGFSSVILGILTIMFLLKENQRIVVVSHEAGATQKLLDRVKHFIKAFETKNKTKIPTKYNSRSEIANEQNNSTIYIGTAGSKSFGRGDTITALHLSEFAFYPEGELLLAGVLQALTPDGLLFIETTANGFNFFKSLWDEADERGFTKHFYSPEFLYDTAFLNTKRGELGRLYAQEYPKDPAEAFLTSGDTYFDKGALSYYLENVREPVTQDLVYV